MGRSTVHYADNETNNILKRLHNKLRPAGTPVERVEYIIELLLLRIFEAKLKRDETFIPLRKLFDKENYRLLFSYLVSLNGEQALVELNKNVFPFYATVLSRARKIISGNLPQKMQDQLVLMEEVFANSNFTNNVKGGVIAEVIGLVNEIEEKYILKTDLLGDAIESALSETGGTQDLGLYRTPGHIRQMMVAMVDPDFTDTIFDPACGTAGFLFDAYDYVIKKARRTRNFPAENVAKMFYRAGIGGIEYQGRIRKMAAVNMYIRGLNPQNISQGDSLKMYDPARDAESKSVVIANPPFGAERDQPAYPNVWEEYSKESETTILFVKLMFDLLKQNGRCAVVVSEGFLTWGQNSACALRKQLLNEANLKSIVSLPQGVFVSKSGQGAKTSILYFEKGKPTDFVWYYKIENDGFSMGTNRKPIEGSNIPELLKLFEAIKQGKQPEDTSRSFCVSKEQIETLDPRVAERIRNEVSDKIREKNAKKRIKLINSLDNKLRNKKITRDMYEDKLLQFDNLVAGQTDNEIAKAVEKAHNYHFNLQNYRSNLSSDQVNEWKEALKNVEPKNGSKIENRYVELQKAKPQTALRILASFNPKDALEMDIAKEYLSRLDKTTLELEEKQKRLEEILRKGFQYSIMPLKDLLIINDEKIRPSDFPEIEFTVLGVSNQTGIFINERVTGDNIKQSYFKVYNNQFCYNPYRINVGSIGFCEHDIDNQIISGAYNVFGCKEDMLNPRYLNALFRSRRFLNYVNQKANGGVRMDFKIESMQEWQIPLPPLEVQNEIVERINRQNQIMEGADRIKNNWTIEIDIPENTEKVLLKDITSYITDGTHKTPNYVSNGIPFISAQNIVDFMLDLEHVKYISNEEYGMYFRNKKLQRDDVLLAKSGTIGVSALFESSEKYAFYESLALIRPEIGKVIPKYLVYFLNSSYSNILTKQNQKGVGVQHLHLEDVRNFEILLPPLEVQRNIVESIEKQTRALEGIRWLKEEAQKRIDEILAQLWGDINSKT